MKLKLLNASPIVVFTILIILLNYKSSGGDIFIQILIFGFALSHLFIVLLIRLFKKYDLSKALLWLIVGFILSYFFYYISYLFALK
jgi:predicted branched-subunit amino acid permease